MKSETFLFFLLLFETRITYPDIAIQTVIIHSCRYKSYQWKKTKCNSSFRSNCIYANGEERKNFLRENHLHFRLYNGFSSLSLVTLFFVEAKEFIETCKESTSTTKEKNIQKEKPFKESIAFANWLESKCWKEITKKPQR